MVPFVGGTGFKHIDFPGGIRGSSLKVHFKDPDLYSKTIDASAYWPFVKCPVMFISSSNDFHSAFDRIYQSMALLKHPNWRVSTNMHQNHGPGPEQWVLLNQWFDQYLKGIDQNIPITPPSTFTVRGNTATFTVTPANSERLLTTEIYYSHDPNSRTRFWNRADGEPKNGTWSAELPVHENLPVYVFALCRYRLQNPVQLEREETSTFSLNSLEQSMVPKTIDLKRLAQLPKTRAVFEDFKQGTRDWHSRDQRSIKTYMFQNPDLDRSNNNQLSIKINPQGKRLALRLNASSKFLSQENNLGDFVYSKRIDGKRPQEIVITRRDFKHQEGKTLEWAKIATFEVTLIDRETNQKVILTSKPGQEFIESINLTKTEPN